VNHDQIKELLSLYALGTLDRDSAEQVQAHLAKGCAKCGALFQQFQSTTNLLPYSLAPKAPPASFKARLMTAITDPAAAGVKADPDPLARTIRLERPAPRQQRWTRPSPALAATLGALLLGVGTYAAYLQTTLDAERKAASQNNSTLSKTAQRLADLTQQIEKQKSELAAATEDSQRAVSSLRVTHDLLAKKQEQLEALQTARLNVASGSKTDLAYIFSSPTMKMTTLSGTDMAKDAYAMIFVEPDAKRGFFYVANLPAAPAGKTYQLWTITDKPISAGVFSLDPGRKGHMMMRNVPNVTHIKQFAVSLEPEGGMPQPSGSIYLAGTL